MKSISSFNVYKERNTKWKYSCFYENVLLHWCCIYVLLFLSFYLLSFFSFLISLVWLISPQLATIWAQMCFVTCSSLIYSHMLSCVALHCLSIRKLPHFSLLFPLSIRYFPLLTSISCSVPLYFSLILLHLSPLSFLPLSISNSSPLPPSVLHFLLYFHHFGGAN